MHGRIQYVGLPQSILAQPLSLDSELAPIDARYYRDQDADEDEIINIIADFINKHHSRIIRIVWLNNSDSEELQRLVRLLECRLKMLSLEANDPWKDIVEMEIPAKVERLVMNDCHPFPIWDEFVRLISIFQIGNTFELHHTLVFAPLPLPCRVSPF